MEIIEKSIEIARPLSAVYNQWTQFEDFPHFMEGVTYVEQIDERRLHWEAEIGGVSKNWDAEIFEQIPDQRIAWRSVNGADNAGAVSFETLGPALTRVTLRLNYTPDGVVENLGDMLGLVGIRVAGDLRRFKEFIENRGDPPHAWRGEIHGREVLHEVM